MPNRDKTGPDGEGSMTGRRRGKCSTEELNSIEKDLSDIEKDVLKKKRNFGKGRGMGRNRED